MSRIRKNIAKTPYQCAVGVAMYHAGDSFGEVCSLADREMYENKRFLKMCE